MKRRLPVLLGLGLLAAAPLGAQVAGTTTPPDQKAKKDETIRRAEEVTVESASKVASKLVDAPATMSVVTSETLAAQPAQNMADTLRWLPKEAGAYRYTLEQVLAEAAHAADGLTREFHIVGGLDMKAGLAYYSEMFRALKANFPHVHIKALTAVEIAHIARIEKMPWRDVLVALKAAGLDTMPGGGAETFSAAVRERISDKKLAGAEYIGVHRTAHELGIRTNCTMLYGHVETLEDRLGHLQMLRDLQDETGGFLAYIPLAYHPDDNELGPS